MPKSKGMYRKVTKHQAINKYAKSKGGGDKVVDNNTGMAKGSTGPVKIA